MTPLACSLEIHICKHILMIIMIVEGSIHIIVFLIAYMLWYANERNYTTVYAALMGDVPMSGDTV